MLALSIASAVVSDSSVEEVPEARESGAARSIVFIVADDLGFNDVSFPTGSAWPLVQHRTGSRRCSGRPAHTIATDDAGAPCTDAARDCAYCVCERRI